MKDFLARLVRVFCWCGLTKEDYASIKKDAYVSNFVLWRHLHALLLVGFSLLSVIFFIRTGLSESTALSFSMALYLAVMNFMFLFVYKKDSLIAQFAIYLTVILLLLYALLTSILHPETLAVTFIVMLVMLPTSVLDKPYFMTLVVVFAVIIYLVSAYPVKTPELFRPECIFAIIYGLFGIAIHIFYNFVRVRDFLLRRKMQTLADEEQRANAETGRLNRTLKKMSESTIELLGDVVEERDAESGDHIRRVKGFTYLLARQVMEDLPEYGLDDYTVELITFASALHDVGKISIPDAILRKPGRLTDEEFEIMKTHCVRGCAIIDKMKDSWARDYLEMGRTVCRCHHEKWDGMGYPDGLVGDAIPIAAQIVSIADIYDALTTKRVYKDAYSYEEAFRMILHGECGAFSDRLLSCFVRCHDAFRRHAENSSHPELPDRDFELVSRANPEESFVIGLHDSNRTLRENLRLGEENAVLEALSENICYICYVSMKDNEVIRYKADEQFARILDSYGDTLRSNERFDNLLNSIIVAEDYDDFRTVTERASATRTILETGHLTTDFRIRLEDGIHYCRMRISPDPNHADAMIIGITRRDEEHAMEAEYLNLQHELELARREMENREKLADRLAVIDCISGEYDYVCSLNADTMDIVVYRAEEWIRDMFKNLEDIVVSPEARAKLSGIIHPDDFARFQEESRHEAVLRGLAQNGTYAVNYRAYKYGQLLRYQTNYALDKNNPKRIIIGLRSMGPVEENR